MAEHRRPRVYAIAAHRGFADALVAGLLARRASDDLGLARLTLLLPNRRAIRTVTEAFVRAGDDGARAGLLLPRMVSIGDIGNDEDEGALGPLLDPLDDGEIPPAVDPTLRWLRLAALIAMAEGEAAPTGAALLRRAADVARSIDRLAVEDIAPERLLADDVLAVVADQAQHWTDSTRRFLRVAAHWRAELATRGAVDAPTRRNLLFRRIAAGWAAQSPSGPAQAAIIAAGITSAAPAVAGLLRAVSELPDGAVVLPDLDLALDDAVWAGLGQAGVPAEPDGPPFGRDDALSHPQYHLKLLLNRMGVARGEVRAWHRAGAAAAPPARSAAISSLFLPAAASAQWADLPEARRRLGGVRLMECAHSGEEAQAIALLIREALETPGRRAALVTPDRGLATRVAAQLARWGIAADDTAGRPLSHSAAGRLALLLAEVLAEDAAPVPLVSLLSHPLVRAGDGRAAWLEAARRFDVMLRGPRPAAGLNTLTRRVAMAGDAALAQWWAEVAAVLTPLFALPAVPSLAESLAALAAAGEALCGEALWDRADGRALGALFDRLVPAASANEKWGGRTTLGRRELLPVLRDAMDAVAVRPLWGGHPRVAIYGLLEARLARADLMICGGLVEGVWPSPAAPDALLPPPVLRHLGVPAGAFRIGLSAHDLAGALGAPEVVLSWATRDARGPVNPSRFVLRVQAMLGERLLERHTETTIPAYARVIDAGRQTPPHPRPRPMPAAAQRRVPISATGLDTLRSDPYQFYARNILRLNRLDPLDAAPSPAWRGQAVHAILDKWHKEGEHSQALLGIAHGVLDAMNAHPLSRALWRPRLVEALEWVAQEVLVMKAAGRATLATEAAGGISRRGVAIKGRADRIDRLPDGSLAIVDYKTGEPPKADRVGKGFSLQLGLIGLIAREAGYPTASGEASKFEYWSLAKNKQRGFGYISEPLQKNSSGPGLAREDFIDRTSDYLDDALNRWILGADPFTARENPDLKVYNDYDQLMRLDEWLPRLGSGHDA